MPFGSDPNGTAVTRMARRGLTRMARRVFLPRSTFFGTYGAFHVNATAIPECTSPSNQLRDLVRFTTVSAGFIDPVRLRDDYDSRSEQKFERAFFLVISVFSPQFDGAPRCRDLESTLIENHLWLYSSPISQTHFALGATTCQGRQRRFR